MNIPAIDLKAQYKAIQKDLDTAIAKVISGTAFVGGTEIGELEEKIAMYCEVAHGIAVNSGTDALYLALRALGIGKGDEVITSPFSFFATAEIICLLGAKPVFVDIDPRTFNIDPSQIEHAITKRTKAILPVHIFGLASDMRPILGVAKKHKLFVVEDACQAIGAEYKGKRVGSLGIISCLSFYPTKNLGAWGDGGMIITNNKKLAGQLRLLRNHGSKKKYFNTLIGVSSRLDTLQAAILLAKFPYLPAWTKRRQNLAHYYNEQLKSTTGISTPYEPSGSVHVYNQYTIRLPAKKRDTVQALLKQHGVATTIYYPVPLHRIPALAYLGYHRNSLPHAEKAAKEVLSLPLFPELKESEIEYIAALLKQHV